MRTYGNVRLYYLPIILALLGLIFVTQPSGKSARQQAYNQDSFVKPINRVEDLKIINQTSAFDVSEIRKISDDLFEITYKNDYSKSITGFEVSVGGMRVQTELILGGDERRFILPGSTFRKTYAAQQGLERHGVQVLAVVFDDGSSDGDIKYIKEITDYRTGMRIERQRILVLLNPVIESKAGDIPGGLEALEAHISSTVSSTQQEGRLDNVALGIRNERRRMLEEIKTIRSKHQYQLTDGEDGRHLREDLLGVKAISEKIIRLASH